VTVIAPGPARAGLPARRASRTLLLTAAIGYSLSWAVGLSVFSSSTDVHSSGAQVLRSYTGHQAAVALQYVLTEGLPAIFLAVITWALAQAMTNAAATSQRLVAAGGLAAATVSLIQLALGLWLTIDLVSDGTASTAASVYTSINRLDGIKMLSIAMLALVVARADRRHELLPTWLAHVTVALIITITLSAIGYLALDDTFAMAAWVSLPCLLVFMTGTGIEMSRHRTRQ
jgi:hypothetical protein